MSPAPLLLVVGMHRSGTSLLGSLLSACGIAMPGPLISGDTHNPEGYFERYDVTALQEQLLIDLERWWPAPRGMQPLPKGWLESDCGQRVLAQLIQLLEAEQHQSPWAIKDPRSSLLLPLWKAACKHLNIPLRLVLAVRDPAEVTVSLVRRDQAMTGMDGWRAQRLWWHHNAEVLQQGRDLPLVVLHYSNWFDPTKSLQQLRALAPETGEAELKSILANTVNPAYRRSHRAVLSDPLAPALETFNRRLESLAMDPSQRGRLLRWLRHQPALPGLAPEARRYRQLKRHFKSWIGRGPCSPVATHPWGYLAEMVSGSQGPAAEQQLERWVQCGFQADELARFAALPAARPVAERWQAPTDQSVAIQVRASDLASAEVTAWLVLCPIQAATPIAAVSFGSSEASTIALNLTDVIPGPEGAVELLKLAQLERVWDPVASRVQLLRNLGVNASWLHPEMRRLRNADNNSCNPSRHANNHQSSRGPQTFRSESNNHVRFLIAGVQKGGTTALASYLREHPQLFIPASKEIHFFDNETLNWQEQEQLIPLYHAHFENAPPGSFWGEATPIYSYWWPAMARIWAYNPAMQLILCLRNPVERAYSHWAMERGREWDHATFQDAITLESERCRTALPDQHRVFSYVSRGFYSEQLRRLWSFFPRHQTLILRQEQLLEDPAETIRIAHHFLGVEARQPSQKLQANRGHYPSTMDPALRSHLQELFNPEITELEQLLGWDLSHWRAMPMG